MHIFDRITGTITGVTSSTSIWIRQRYNGKPDRIQVYNKGDRDSHTILFYNNLDDARKEMSGIALALKNREPVYPSQFNVSPDE